MQTRLCNSAELATASAAIQSASINDAPALRPKSRIRWDGFLFHTVFIANTAVRVPGKQNIGRLIGRRASDQDRLVA